MERRNLRKRVTDTAEFARIAETILQTAEDARNVADVCERFTESSQTHRLREKLAHEFLTAFDFVEFKRGRREPAFEESCAGGSDRAIDRSEQRTVSLATARREYFQVPQR